MLTSQASVAQPICIPGTGCKIELKPPIPTTWSPPPLQGGTQGQTNLPPVGGGVSLPTVGGQVDPGQAQWQLELERRARWDAYFQWRAQVTAEAKASIDVRFHIDGLKWKIRSSTTDPYLAQPPPSYGIPVDGGFKGMGVGLLGFCWGFYDGPGTPYYYGWCPNVRIRPSKSKWVGIAVDPAVVGSYHGKDTRGFGMFGLRPGVELTFLKGKRTRGATRGYAVAGGDVWFPFADRGRAPTAFLGGHAGLGLSLSWEGFVETGFEVRGLLRGGLGSDNSFAREMSLFRKGIEIRWNLLSFGF